MGFKLRGIGFRIWGPWDSGFQHDLGFKFRGWWLT